jgi:hypothetical protein
VLPPLSGGSGFRRRLAVLATGSLAFLFVQESLERSLNAGDLRLPAFSISAWILVMLALAFAALLVALTQHSCSALLALARGRARVRRPSWRPLNRPKGVEPPRRRHPLADQRGLRAPPLPAR